MRFCTDFRENHLVTVKTFMGVDRGGFDQLEEAARIAFSALAPMLHGAGCGFAVGWAPAALPRALQATVAQRDGLLVAGGSPCLTAASSTATRDRGAAIASRASVGGVAEWVGWSDSVADEKVYNNNRGVWRLGLGDPMFEAFVGKPAPDSYRNPVTYFADADSNARIARDR